MMFFLSVSTLASLVALFFLDFLGFLIFLLLFLSISISIFISWSLLLFFTIFLLAYRAIILWSSSLGLRRLIWFIRRVFRLTFIRRLIPRFFILFRTLLFRLINLSLIKILNFGLIFSLIIALFGLLLLPRLCSFFPNIFFGRIFGLIGLFFQLLHGFLVFLF